MSGGVAYVLDTEGEFHTNCNMEMVELEKLEHAEEIAVVKGLIEEHLQHTGSAVAERLLGDWENTVETFVKVMPTDYRRVISQTGDLSVGVPGPDAVQPRDRPAAE
jgi:glutamate synthase domain-containing protein 3